MEGKQSEGLGRWEIVILAVTLLVAGLLRFGPPGLIEFKRDEAVLLARALDVAEFKVIHLRGISSSVGFPNFPMAVWLYALPLLVWKHVYAATVFTALVNTAAVFGCWWLTRRYWGNVAGLAAAMMYAVSPWAIFHSQKIWAQNLLAPVVVAWAICAALAFIEQRNLYTVLHFVLLALAIQIHYAALALVPATLLFLILFRRRVNWTIVLAGLLLAFLMALPFLVGLLKAGQFNLAAVSGAIGNGEPTLDLKGWRYASLLTTGREIHALAGPETFRDLLSRVPDLTAVHLLWAALALAGLGWLGWAAWKGRGQDAADCGAIVLIWMLAPPLFFTLPLLPVELHYLLTIYPAVYIAGGVAFALLLSRLGRWGWAGWSILVVTAGAQAAVWIVLLSYISSHSTPGGYGTPVRYHLQAANAARALLDRSAAKEVLLVGSSENTEVDEFAAVYAVLLRDVPHRVVDVNRSALFPAASSVVVMAPQAGGPGGAAYLQAADQIDQISLRPEEGTVPVLLLPTAAAPNPEVPLDPAYVFANQVTLVGYDNPQIQADGTALWQFLWHPASNPDPADFHFFNHLMDGDGQRLSQADAPAFAPWQWQAGDTVQSFFFLDWPQDPTGRLTMRTGIYTYPELQNIPLLDPAGNPAGDAAVLPLTTAGPTADN